MDTQPIDIGSAKPTREQLLAQLMIEQNFLIAIPAGIGAAIIGAVVWAAVVVETKMELGIIAVAVGALVGYAVKLTGKGIDPKFGFLGAGCAALGWGLGTILSDIGFLANAQNMSFGAALQSLDIGRLNALVAAVFQPMDALFLAIAVYEGYKFSFRIRRR